MLAGHPIPRQSRVVPTIESDCHGCAAALRLLHEAGEILARPVLVGIGGPGGSGKSSFATRLARQLSQEYATTARYLASS